MHGRQVESQRAERMSGVNHVFQYLRSLRAAYRQQIIS